MSLKVSATRLVLIFDAVASLVTSAFSLDRERSWPNGRETDPKEPAASFVARATQFVVLILSFLAGATLILSAINLLTLSANSAGRAQLPAEQWHYSVLVAALVLLVTGLALLAALLLQDKRRKALEALLAERERGMALVARAADLGLWRWDAVTDRFWLTPHCRTMLSIAAAADFGMADMTKSIHSDDRAAVTTAIKSCLERGSLSEVEYRIRSGDGEWCWMRTRARAFRAADGRVSSITGTLMNITEQKETQAEVERQRQSLTHLARVRTLGELSGGLAHELNQPLTAILSNAQATQRMIELAPFDADEIKCTLQDIADQAKRAADIIRHLRSLLKGGKPELGVFDVNKLVESTLGLTRSDLMTRGVVITNRQIAGCLPVRGDAVQLQQLLLNLLCNSAEAMAEATEPGGPLIISTDAIAAKWVHIAVSDKGPGIDPAVMPKLFDPFFSTKPHGLGLGLSLCRAIAEGHKGRIWAENNQGEGATFHVYFPLAKEMPP